QRNQQPGLGFPICRIVGAFDLGNGALMDVAVGTYGGKGSGEQSLLGTLLDTFRTEDIILGDALYCTYFVLAELQTRGSDAVFEQHGARRLSTDFRRGQQLGPRDHLITWHKPKQKPVWLTQAAYDATPDTLTVREL